MSENKSITRESKAPRDLSGVLKDAPPGAWVALSVDKTRIVGTGDSIKAATVQAHLNGEDGPVLIRMPFEGEGLVAGVK